jgi:hypothetical protein
MAHDPKSPCTSDAATVSSGKLLYPTGSLQPGKMPRYRVCSTVEPTRSPLQDRISSREAFSQEVALLSSKQIPELILNSGTWKVELELKSDVASRDLLVLQMSYTARFISEMCLSSYVHTTNIRVMGEDAVHVVACVHTRKLASRLSHILGAVG